MFVNLSYSSAVDFDNAISVVYHHIDFYFKLMPTNFLSVIINMWMTAMNDQGCGSLLYAYSFPLSCVLWWRGDGFKWTHVQMANNIDCLANGAKVSSPLSKWNFQEANSKLFKYRLQIDLTAWTLSLESDKSAIRLQVRTFFFLTFSNHTDSSPALFVRRLLQWSIILISTYTPSMRQFVSIWEILMRNDIKVNDLSSASGSVRF